MSVPFTKPWQCCWVSPRHVLPCGVCGLWTLICLLGPWSKVCCLVLDVCMHSSGVSPRAHKQHLGVNALNSSHPIISLALSGALVFSPPYKKLGLCLFHSAASLPGLCPCLGSNSKRTERVRKQWFKNPQIHPTWTPALPFSRGSACGLAWKNRDKKKERGYLAVSLCFRRRFPAPQPELEGSPKLFLHCSFSTSVLELLKTGCETVGKRNGKTHHQLSFTLNYGLLSKFS